MITVETLTDVIFDVLSAIREWEVGGFTEQRAVDVDGVGEGHSIVWVRGLLRVV